MSIESYGTGRYGRILGVVYIDQTNVNLEMVKVGYAEVYRGRPAKGFDPHPFWEAEGQAKVDRLKIWSLGDDYVNLRMWRRKGK